MEAASVVAFERLPPSSPSSELSWDIAEWLEAKLDDDDRRAVDDARKRTIAELRSGLEQHSVPADDLLGLPDAPAAVALLDGLVRHPRNDANGQGFSAGSLTLCFAN